MNITMRYLINIMDIGNKCIIICPPVNEKIFPFTETLSCLLPVGNTTLLNKLLQQVSAYDFHDIILLGMKDAGLETKANHKRIHVKEMKENIFLQLQEEFNDCKQMLILYGNTWLDNADLHQLMERMKKGSCSALIKEYDSYDRSIDGFGVDAQEEIKAIFAHPREHYVNGKLCKAYVWNEEMKDFLTISGRGFHHVNCGQMPDTSFYIEEAMQNAIEHGVKFQSVSAVKPFQEVMFPWDIAIVNELACKETASMQNDRISDDTKLDASCKRYGFLETGNDVIIQDGVIFEGNCKIGNHVTIEKGAIIGKNCIINDGSIIRYQCRLNDHTVIGTNNKIGYHAEVSGVTFDGVCVVHSCEIFGVIGKKVDLAAGVRMAILRFDDTYVTQNIKGKKYQNPYTNYIFIGDYCRTGVGNIFLPGVKVGSRSAIGPGVLVEKDIDQNSLVLLKQETIVKEWGSHRYGW